MIDNIVFSSYSTSLLYFVCLLYDSGVPKNLFLIEDRNPS